MGLVPDQKPWYKHAYLWLVILLPVLAVTVSLWFVTVAFSHQDDVVRDDWYMDGKTLQQDLSRDTVAAQAGLSAQFQIDAQGNINATLTSAQADFSWPATLELSLFHPVHASQDQQVTLSGTAIAGQYSGSLQALPQLTGKYHAELANKTVWRLQGDVVLPITTFDLSPQNQLLKP
jgi:hypothetical protein